MRRDDRIVAPTLEARSIKTAADLSVALRLRRMASALYRQDHGAAGERGRAPYRRLDARLFRRLPRNAGGDRAGKCRDLQAQWRRAIFLYSVPERQRRRDGCHSPACVARASGLDLTPLAFIPSNLTCHTGDQILLSPRCNGGGLRCRPAICV